MNWLTSPKTLDTGLRARLYLTFGGIVVSLAVAVGAALYAIDRLGGAISDITLEQTPRMVAALRLSEHGARLASALPVLTASDTPELLKSRWTEVEEITRQLRGLLPRLQSESTNRQLPSYNANIEIDSFFTILEQVRKATGHRLEQEAGQKSLVNQLRILQADLSDTLTPALYGVSSLNNLLTRRDAREQANRLNELLDSPTPGREQREALERELREGIPRRMAQTVGHLSDAFTLKAEGNLLLALLASTGDADRLDTLAGIEERFLRAMESFRGAVRGFRGSPLADRNPILIQSVIDIETRILNISQGSDGVFESQRQLLKTQQEIAALLDNARAAAAAMTRRIDALVNEMEAGAERAHDAVRADSAFFFIILILVFSTGLALAILIAHLSVRAMSRDAKALETARQAAESANRAKSAFLANMSHELRTPLNAVLGFTQLLLREPNLANEQRTALTNIEQGGNHLLTLINDILDLAKIEAGRFDLLPGPASLPELLQAVAAMAEVRAQQKQVGFQFEQSTRLPPRVEMDEKRVREVLLNLLGNAVKFTEQGGVRFRAGCRSVTPDQGATLGEGETVQLTFEVEDTGIGIPPERIAGLFRPFQQEGSLQYRNQGTGLGLAISQRLVEQMGGEIQMKSQPGKGSRFTVLFPVRVLSPAGSESPTLGSSRGITGYRRRQGGEEPLRLLIVDDISANREVLRWLLEPLGFEIVQAESGSQAIEAVVRQRPDLVFMDLKMPEMDGLETTQRLLALPNRADLPVVAYSAAAFIEDRERCSKVGCRGHLAKPLNANLVLALIADILNLEWIKEGGSGEVGVPANAEHSTRGGLEPAEICTLAEETRERLLGLARRGNITQLRKELELMDAGDAFVAKLREAAGQFNMKRLRTLLEGETGA